MKAKRAAALPDPKLPLTLVKQERFAHALARGMTPAQAAAAAGYGDTSTRARERTGYPQVAARVVVLKTEYEAGGEATLEQLLSHLIKSARDAAGLGSAAGFAAVRGLTAEAVKLKLLLEGRAPAAETAAETVPARRPNLTVEQWLAHFKPHTGSDDRD